MQDSHNESRSLKTAAIEAGGMVKLGIRWAGAIMSVGLVLGIVYWAFLLGQRDASELPVIRAMAGDARITPDDPGGTQADHQGLAVNEVLGETTPTAVSTDTALAPDAQSLTSEDESMANLGNTAPAVRAEPVRVDASSLLVEILPTETTPEPTPTPEPVDITPSVAADGMSLPIRRPPSFSTNNPVSNFIDGLVNEALPEEGDTSFETEELPRPEPLYGNVQLDPGDVLIQLGAYESVEDADIAWIVYNQFHGDLLGDLKRYIEPVEAGGRVLYRLRASGLNDLNESRALCAALDARDVDCISATVQ